VQGAACGPARGVWGAAMSAPKLTESQRALLRRVCELQPVSNYVRDSICPPNGMAPLRDAGLVKWDDLICAWLVTDAGRAALKDGGSGPHCICSPTKELPCYTCGAGL
jgi:hypothetical protein